MNAVREHNFEVIRALAGQMDDMSPRAAWTLGLTIGMALGLRSPKTAKDLRSTIETRVAEVDDATPEQAEVLIRHIADLFDRSADQ